MDRERGFSFKLLVPPRVSPGQVSAVRPQEVPETRTNFLSPLQQGFTKCYNKEQPYISNASILGPTKPKRQDSVKMTVVSPMKKENSNTGQLYTKLFDEVEKMQIWKLKTETDTAQKERKLNENKRTIETQRKAIQELQFGNESLSIKLEEQISDNDELKNRDNATRNLCNILKDTFERSVEKMHLFECEREETHHLLLVYQDTLQKQMEAFESLHFKAEATQEELLKAKEELMQFEDLKYKFQQEYNMKEEEIRLIQATLSDSDNKLNNILLDLQETKVKCKILQEEIDQKSELLTSSKAEHDSLCKELQEAEQRSRETERAMSVLVTKNEEAAGIIHSKDLNLEELSNEKTELTLKLGQMQLTIDELKTSLAAETQKAHELEERVTTNLAEVEKAKHDLGEMRKLSAEKQEQINRLTEQLNVKTESLEALNSQITVVSGRAEELTTQLLNKTEEARQLKEACENAEKGFDELKAKFTLSQVRVDELQTDLTNEKKQNGEKTSETFQLKKEITEHKCTLEKLMSDLKELQSVKSILEQKLENRCISAHTVEENIKMSEEKARTLTDKMEKIENENHQLHSELDSIKNTLSNKCQEMETLKKSLQENEENLNDEMSKKERRIKVIEAQNKALKKQVSKETVKSTELLETVNNLQEENQNLKIVHKEESDKLLEDQQKASAAAKELETEIQTLRSKATEAIRLQEDAELKCQNKIADMVALMEKHKNQYDRMVQEKEAELEANKEKEMKAVAQGKSANQALSKQKKENDSLKKELNKHIQEKENLQKELIELKNKLKNTQMQSENKQLPISDDGKEAILKTPGESLLKLYRFDFSKSIKTPSSTKYEWPGSIRDSQSTVQTSTPKSMGSRGEKGKAPKSTASRASSKIKSYRIRTPPSTAKKAAWEKGIIDFDPKSDSSGQGDILMFANTLTPSASQSKNSLLRKSRTPLNSKSPKNNLKLAAVKRMRDAGWTAVTGNEKKKKTNENIFA